MRHDRQFVRRRDTEGGFVLIAVLFLVALILIGLAVAAPKIAKSIQRDKELELVHRGEQYKRAIKLYYRKFGAYPANMDQLMNTNQIRFLRKRYPDPFTGKDDWKVIYFGQAHVKPMGLFGQPITNGGLAGTAGSSALGGTGTGGVGTPIGSSGSATGSAFGSTTGSGSGSTDGSGFSGTSSGGSSSGFGSDSGSSFGGGSGIGSSTGSGIGSGTGSGIGSSTGGTGFGSSPGATTGTGSGTGSAFGSSDTTGSTLGGGPIVGVVIPDTRASLKEYKKQKHYNEWEFVYDPMEDQMQAMGLGGGAQPNLNGSTTTPGSTGFGSTTGGATLMNGGQQGSQFGSGSNGTGGGTGGGTGSAPETPSPQQ
jgi:type II secretory pathway pseudopilin PulG